MKRAIGVLLVVLVAACSPAKKEEVQDVASEGIVNESLAPDAFKQKLESEPDGVLLDVRTPEEVSQGIIAGAKNVDFKGSEFDQTITSLDKDKTYFVYCASGGRSGKTANLMKEKGFKKVYSLEGGMTAWKEKGLEVVNP